MSAIEKIFLGPNGVKEFHYIHEDGTGHILTEAKHGRSWERSHSHAYRNELYVVQRGTIKIAWAILGGNPQSRVLKCEDTHLVKPETVHSVQMSGECVLLTLRFGDSLKREDLIMAPEFDLLLHSL